MTVIGINPREWSTIDEARSFVNSKGLTFANLWDGSNSVWKHYGSPYTSRTWVIDKHGNRVSSSAFAFNAAAAQKLVDALE